MRILIVSTSDATGGAAVAAHRLMEALNNNGEKARMLVRDKQTDDISVVKLPQQWRHKWSFLWERLTIFSWLHFRRHNLFGLDVANSGADITQLDCFRKADIIHLNWVNQGMLSLRGIRKILDSGKPVVWTMHDAWPSTAICHVTMDCKNFQTICKNCKYLPDGGSEHDLAWHIWRKKLSLYQHRSIAFVACSKWLERDAKRSALFQGQSVTHIPNPIDTRIFSPGDKNQARQLLNLPLDKKILLFVAQRVSNELKGMAYLQKACKQLCEQQPELKDQLHLLILGGDSSEMNADESGLTCTAVPYTYDQSAIVNIYRAADAFVLPSLSENLPNTIMESLACGVPCIGFKVGGIPEMIDHLKNGYVARYRSAKDLAEGIRWTLFEADSSQLSHEALRKVKQNYSQQVVAMEYIEVYNEALAQKQLKL